MLISQAVYAAFCECFIDSYPQFGEQFKELVIRIVHEWLTGGTFRLTLILDRRYYLIVLLSA